MANERRLIDMDETIKQLRDYADRKHANGHNDAANGILNAVSYIRNNITRVDAVKVVRCRDCEWRDEDGDCVNPKCNKSWYGCHAPDEHYCSYGEKSSTQPQREDV